MRTRLFAAVSALLVLGLVPRPTIAQRNPDAPIPNQPGHWVAFAADMDNSAPQDAARPARKVLGRFYRDDTGSERIESWPEPQPIEGLTMIVISIKNIPVERFYTYTPQTGWISQPMKLPPGRWEPRPLYATEDERRHIEQSEGLELYPTGPASEIRLIAPALNGAVVARRSSSNGYQRVLQNIKIGSQSAALFEPPPAADVLKSGEFGGIVSFAAGEPHQAMPGLPSDIRDLIEKRVEAFYLKYPQAKNLRPPQ